jgi:hypothetical protein
VLIVALSGLCFRLRGWWWCYLVRAAAVEHEVEAEERYSGLII